MTGITVTLNDFRAWLFEELEAVWCRRRGRKSPSFSVKFGTAGTRFPAEVQFAGTDAPVVVQSPDELEQTIKSRPRRLGSTCRIIMSGGRYVVRNLADINLPRSRAREMALIDVAMSTPFDVDDIYLAYPAPVDRRPGTAYCILKKSDLQACLQVIQRRGYSIIEFVLQRGDDGLALDKRSLSALNPPGFNKQLSRWLTAACIVAFIAGPIGLLTITNQRAETAKAMLESEIQTAQKAVKLARSRLERQNRIHKQMSSLRAKKDISESVVYVWEQLSRILPDGTWLSDFSLEDNTITLSGFSTSAVAVIPLLEQSGQFYNPRFTTSVNRVPGRDFERFTLQTRYGMANPGS